VGKGVGVGEGEGMRVGVGEGQGILKKNEEQQIRSSNVSFNVEL